MPIDEPVGILITQIEEDADAANYLPTRMTELGWSAAAAATLASHPFIASVVSNIFRSRAGRFEGRMLSVLKEMDEQRKRIEERIEDKTYYDSEEFETLIMLALERLHTTNDREKLKMFGDALANCGDVDFKSDDKEAYIRILRDFSAKDLHTLGQGLHGWTINSQITDETLSSLSRLVGNGLVVDRLEIKRPSNRFGGSARETAIRQLEELITTPPVRRFDLSEFGKRFLKFIAAEQTPSTNQQEATG